MHIVQQVVLAEALVLLRNAFSENTVTGRHPKWGLTSVIYSYCLTRFFHSHGRRRARR